MTMMNFESLTSFSSALEEVETLIIAAESEVDNKLRYLTYNKASLLLLLGKFENFLEQSIEEYVERINSLSLYVGCIPDDLKINHSIYLFEKNKETLGQKHKQDEQTELFVELGTLWRGNEIFRKLSVNSKFNYGKHGGKEMVRLFNNIAIPDIFEVIKVYEKKESMLSDELAEVNLKDEINTMTNLRNNIIHQDATPNLTHVNLVRYRDFLKDFAHELVAYLVRALSEIASNRESVSTALKDIAATLVPDKIIVE